MTVGKIVKCGLLDLEKYVPDSQAWLQFPCCHLYSFLVSSRPRKERDPASSPIFPPAGKIESSRR